MTCSEPLDRPPRSASILRINGSKVELGSGGTFLHTMKLPANENTVNLEAERDGVVTKKKIQVNK